jgi:hypothetical protein
MQYCLSRTLGHCRETRWQLSSSKVTASKVTPSSKERKRKRSRTANFNSARKCFYVAKRSLQIKMNDQDESRGDYPSDVYFVPNACFFARESTCNQMGCHGYYLNWKRISTFIDLGWAHIECAYTRLGIFYEASGTLGTVTITLACILSALGVLDRQRHPTLRQQQR